MKIVASVVAATLALAWIVPDDAAAQSRGARGKAKKGQVVARSEPRSASVGANGLCQRDTGTPNDKLNFRNPCDVEEFWRRIMDRASESSR